MTPCAADTDDVSGSWAVVLERVSELCSRESLRQVPDLDAIEAIRLIRLLISLTASCSESCTEHVDCATQSSQVWRCGDASPAMPRGQALLVLYVEALRLLKGEDWFTWLFRTVPYKRFGLAGWHKLGTDGVPAALLHTCGAVIRDNGDVECGPTCPPLPEVPRE